MIVWTEHRATAGKVWSLHRFWVSIHSYKKQPVKIYFDRILDLARIKFAMAALSTEIDRTLIFKTFLHTKHGLSIHLKQCLHFLFSIVENNYIK